MLKDAEILNLKAIQAKTDLTMFRKTDAMRVLNMGKDAFNEQFADIYRGRKMISIGELAKAMTK